MPAIETSQPPPTHGSTRRRHGQRCHGHPRCRGARTPRGGPVGWAVGTSCRLVPRHDDSYRAGAGSRAGLLLEPGPADPSWSETAVDQDAIECGRCRRDADTMSPADGDLHACPTCATVVCPDCWNLVASACLGCAPFMLPTDTTTRQPRPRPAPAAIATPAAPAGDRPVGGPNRPAAARDASTPRRSAGSATGRQPSVRTILRSLAGGSTLLVGVAVAALAFSSLGARPVEPTTSPPPSIGVPSVAPGSPLPVASPTPRLSPPATPRPKPKGTPRPAATPRPTAKATPRPTPRPVRMTPPPPAPPAAPASPDS